MTGLDATVVAKALGGDVAGRDQVLAPGPGHSPADRSMSIKIGEGPDGFMVYSHAGDDTMQLRDYVRDKLGLPPFNPGNSGNYGDSGINGTRRPKVVATYTYRDERGRPHMRVSRTADKRFWQSRWDGRSFVSGIKGLRLLPYRLPELLASPDAAVFIVEGEKDADRLAALGLVATTNPMGAGKWRDELNRWFSGRVCYVLADNDDVGREHAEAVACSLSPVVATVRVVHLPGLAPKEDVSDWLDADGTIERLIQIAEAAPEWRQPSGARADHHEQAGSASVADPWDSPDLTLLGTGRRPAPEPPLDLLGPFWADWAARRAAGASAPVDYVMSALLASASALLANVRWPLAGADWAEPPVLWAAIVGGPSAGKSPAMDCAFDLIHHVETAMAAGFEEELRAHEANSLAAKARAEAWETEVRNAAKDGGAIPPKPDGAEIPDEPTRPRVRVSDTTTEKLAALAAALPRGLLVHRDELAGWFGGFDRYSGTGADRAFAVEMYGGRRYIVDRVRHSEPITIRRLSVAVLGGIQPDRLAAVVNQPDDGLVARFLWTWPDALPEFNLAREVAPNDDAKQAFVRLAALVMALDDERQAAPVRVRLTLEAEHDLEDFAREMNSRAKDASGVFGSTIGKTRGHALRLAAVIEYLWWCAEPGLPEPRAVSSKAVKAAAGLLEGYFLPMAERALGDAALPTVERNAMTVIRHVRRERLPTFNAREVRHQLGGSLREAAAMRAACEALVEDGLARPIEASGKGAGRKPLNFEVNPVVFREGRS